MTYAYEVDRVLSTVEVHSDTEWAAHVFMRVSPDGTQIQIRVVGEDGVHCLRPGETMTLRFRALLPDQADKEGPK